MNTEHNTKEMSSSSDHVEITADPLVHDDIVARAHDEGAGAIATFIGITRNIFEGKQVIKLEYECYKPMVRGPRGVGTGGREWELGGGDGAWFYCDFQVFHERFQAHDETPQEKDEDTPHAPSYRDLTRPPARPRISQAARQDGRGHCAWRGAW